MTIISADRLSSVMFGACFIILTALCVILLTIMDLVRLNSGWKTRGLMLVSLFGLCALIGCILDPDQIFGVNDPGAAGTAAGQLLFLWAPFILMIYYYRVVRKDLAVPLKRILIFDAGLAVYLMILFYILPKERVVTEVFSVFILLLSVASVVYTLFKWHGGQEGYGRIYWESAALIALFVTGLLRLAFRENGMYGADIRANTRLGGVGAFMLTMTVIQIYAMFMEFRVTVERTSKELEKKSAELERLMSTVVAGSESAASDEETQTASYPEKETAGTLPDDLPSVEGLDWNIAWLYLRDKNMLTEGVRTFYELIDTQADRLDEFYEGVVQKWGESELSSYRIQVHGMKSSAATVGIVPLAGTAALLEYSARDADIEAILGAHGMFQRRWRSYREKLKGVFGCGEDDDPDKETYDPDVVCAMLTIVKNAMEDLDIDAADEAVKELLKYDYPEEAREKLAALKASVTDLDTDGTEENVSALAGILGIQI